MQLARIPLLLTLVIFGFSLAWMAALTWATYVTNPFSLNVLMCRPHEMHVSDQLSSMHHVKIFGPQGKDCFFLYGIVGDVPREPVQMYFNACRMPRYRIFLHLLRSSGWRDAYCVRVNVAESSPMPGE